MKPKIDIDNIKHWEEGTVLTTKEIAHFLHVTTAQAYKELCLAELAGVVSKYGYRVGPGIWDDIKFYPHKKNSLGWQKNLTP